MDWLILERPGKVRTLSSITQEQNGHQHRSMKASIRAKVEHPFRIIKRQFGFVEKPDTRLLKNDNQLARVIHAGQLFRADQMIRQWEDLTKNWG